MTLESAQQQLQVQLKSLYDEREAANITNWVMEHISGKKKIERLLTKHLLLPENMQLQLQQITKELLTHKPVQYVLGEAWFCGMNFFVNEHVLIPRPETEELVDWVVGESEKSKVKSQKLLEIGSGSGCIPISLKKKLAGNASITSIDISKDALLVAKKNANALDADVLFLNIDFLDEESWKQWPVFDCIISNPPYIKRSEEKNMAKNVLDFEPGIALFVPDEDALLFYWKIALFAKEHLAKKGSIFLEINEALGEEVIELYNNLGFAVELRKDLQGKDRMIKANFKI